ncbi:murein hydrolase activator EnvC family protein [Tumebacillus lipolyticus]|uniref:Murein hydrolase activator EnvC family protein n=1 Tax=Tumebacillus lipolyticus TaxID=1280370 RepID=A0ABW5A365_9BACL
MSQKGKQFTACLLAGLLLIATLPDGALAAEQKGEQAETIEQEMKQVDRELHDTLDRMKALEAELTEGMKENERLKGEIATLEKRIAEQKAKLNERMKVIYEKGEVSFWEVLFQATDFSDFLDRVSLLSMIVKQDQELIDSLRSDQEQLKVTKENLEQQQQARKQKQEEMRQAEQELQARAKSLKSDLAEAIAAKAAEQAAIEEAQQKYQGPQFIESAGGGALGWPVPSSFLITSGYGFRGSEFHKGIDIGAAIGTPFVAAADGVVIQAGAASGFGHWIVVDHGNGVTSIYGHMYANGVFVHAGQAVKQGQVIGSVGNDGVSTGPHLHFGVQQGGSYVNPMSYLQ